MQVIKDNDGRYRFKDEEGNLSKDSYYFAGHYNYGYALVQKEEDGPFQFRDYEGNLSEEYNQAGRYNHGCACVQKEPGGRFRYRDTKGRLSKDSYYDTEGYWESDYCDDGGYTRVIKEAGEGVQYRDLLGNLSIRATIIGDEYYRYWQGKIDLFDLDEECFKDPKFVAKMKEIEMEKIKKALSFAETDEHESKVMEMAKEITGYINDMVFIANEEECKEVLAGEEQEEKDNVEENKNEILKNIEDLFRKA